jgi:hypothetical protein
MMMMVGDSCWNDLFIDGDNGGSLFLCGGGPSNLSRLEIVTLYRCRQVVLDGCHSGGVLQSTIISS